MQIEVGTLMTIPWVFSSDLGKTGVHTVGAMDVTKPYEFIGLGAMDVTNNIAQDNPGRRRSATGRTPG